MIIPRNLGDIVDLFKRRGGHGGGGHSGGGRSSSGRRPGSSVGAGVGAGAGAGYLIGHGHGSGENSESSEYYATATDVSSVAGNYTTYSSGYASATDDFTYVPTTTDDLDYETSADSGNGVDNKVIIIPVVLGSVFLILLILFFVMKSRRKKMTQGPLNPNFRPTYGAPPMSANNQFMPPSNPPPNHFLPPNHPPPSSNPNLINPPPPAYKE